MIPQSASGVLLERAEAEELDLADVHVAQRLGALAGESSEQALLGVALCVRNLREGSVRLDLDAHPLVAAALEGSPLLDGPLVREGRYVWLAKYHCYEVSVARDLLARLEVSVTADVPRLHALFVEDDDQRAAAVICAGSAVSVLGGGPGTGKTATVARLLAGVRTPDSRIALAAYTGKAAARLRDSLVGAFGVPSDERAWLAELPCLTIHRLLGVRRGSAQFVHHAGNQLPYDIVVIDEASMLPLTLFAKLLEALRPEARLILVGDPNQLASIEAGAVLADVVDGARVTSAVATLTMNHRFPPDSGIARLSRAVVAGHPDEAVEVLQEQRQDVTWNELADETPLPISMLRPLLVGQLRLVIEAARRGEVEAALAALEQHRVLCAHRSGSRGVGWFELMVPQWLQADVDVRPRADGRYVGQPLLVLANDYDNKLFNGDTGVVLSGADGLVAHFGEREIPLGRLGDVRPMYAMTVHRAQGSQFHEVTFVVPPPGSALGTREMLYTAVTRVERNVRLIGSEQSIRQCVERRSLRATGLSDRLSS